MSTVTAEVAPPATSAVSHQPVLMDLGEDRRLKTRRARRQHPWLGDLLFILLLSAAAFGASLYGASRVPSHIVEPEYGNVWFDADCPRVFANAIDSTTECPPRHPLFCLFTYLPVQLLRGGLGADPLLAIRIVMAGLAAAWIAVFFFLLRLLGCYRLDAALFSLVAATSASAVFWFTVPETFPFGSLTLLLGLGLVAAQRYRQLPERWFVLISASTLSFTVTNWMVGLLATFTSFPWRRALQITVNAFCLVVLLWAVQRRLYGEGAFFITFDWWQTEGTYMLRPETGGPVSVLRSFFFHSMVMPATQEVHWSVVSRHPFIVTQLSAPGSAGPFGLIAAALWSALLGLGVWGALRMREHRQFVKLLCLTLAGQLALHLLFGVETFLFACHFGPLLVVWAALGTRTRARPLALALAGAMVISTGINNALQFGRATRYVKDVQETARAGKTLRGADLRQADLPGAALPEANLFYARLQRAKLQKADLRGAYLRKARLHLATLQGAALRQADLRDAYLFRTDLSGADLTGADLRGADLTGADLTGARLALARYDRATQWPDRFCPIEAGAEFVAASPAPRELRAKASTR